jgi:hypothetical protein
MDKAGLTIFKQQVRRVADYFIELSESPFTDEQKSAALIEIVCELFDDAEAHSWAPIVEAENDPEAATIVEFVEILDRLTPTDAATERAFQDHPAEIIAAKRLAAKLIQN